MIDPATDDELALISSTQRLDNADTVANWTSSNSTRFTPSQDTSDKQEGTGSVQVIASSVTDDVFYFLKTVGVGNTSIATKYATIDLEIDVKSVTRQSVPIPAGVMLLLIPECLVLELKET